MSYQWNYPFAHGYKKTSFEIRKRQSTSFIIKLIVNEEVQQGLSLAHIPTSISFILTENNLLADSTASEERVSKSRLTISMNVYKELCCIHKPGGMGISQDILTGCLKLA